MFGLERGLQLLHYDDAKQNREQKMGQKREVKDNKKDQSSDEAGLIRVVSSKNVEGLMRHVGI